MLNQGPTLIGRGSQEEESVEDLLQKLAKKGKKVKLVETASVRELPKQEDDSDGDMDRDSDNDIEEEFGRPNKKSVKKRKK